METMETKVNTTNADFRTNLRKKGYRLSDYANYQSVLMLALVKYADLNFQSCLGPGWNSGNSRQASNGDSILGDDGYVNLSNSSIKVMGIVDFYGNVWKNCDATFEYGGCVCINDDLDNITAWPTMSTWQAMGYKKTNIVLGSGDGAYISDISDDSPFPFVTYPIAGSGDSINPIGDGYYTNNDASMRSVILGGYAWVGLVDGPFAWDSHGGLLSAGTSVGALASAFPVESASSL